jgi:hypothetical protein
MKLFAQPFWLRLITAIVLAKGLNVAWVLVLGAATTGLTLLGWISTVPYGIEELIYAQNGRFLIVCYDPSIGQYVYRDLNGISAEAPKPDVRGVDILGPRGADFRSSQDSSWDSRLIATTDRPPGRNATTWYGVLDRNHRLYFEGFDQASQLSVGYLGRRGFRKTLPPREEWFVLRNGSVNRQGIWVTSWRRIVISGAKLDTVEHGAYLLDEGSLQEIDFAQRTVRAVLADSPAVSMLPADYFQPVEQPKGESSEPDLRLLRSRVLLRSSDQLFVVNPKTAEVKNFAIPEDLREQDSLKVFLISDRELAVTSAGTVRDGLRKLELRKLSATGKVTETIPVELAEPSYGVSARGATWTMLLFMPIPWLWAVARYGYNPPPLLDHLADIWPPLVALHVISLLAAFWVYRSERQHYGTHPLAWSITTFLLGPAMLVAYLIERGRPITTTCGECHAQVPAKRDACVKCGAEFPAPERTGCEIFAA